MCQLIETIKVEKRKLFNIRYHNQRMNLARKENFGLKEEINLNDFITLPKELDSNIYKCRVTYSNKVEKIEFESYKLKKLNRLKVVFCDDVNYEYKYKDRKKLNKLIKQRGVCDDIIITKNGYVTDGSYFNLAFFKDGKWYTPSTPLLKGTKRASLLDTGELTEIEIKYLELEKFSKISPINAFMELGEILVKCN